MPGKNIPAPAFADDDGSADPALTEALEAWQSAPSASEARPRLLAALAGARLFVPVVAVLGESETDEAGLRRDKTSDMAVPTLTGPDGRKALPVFTSTATLARWRSDARPVAVPLRQALHALAQEGADTLVLDLAGPVTHQLTGGSLRALAEGRTSAAPADDPSVAEALRQVLAADPEVRGAHLAPGGEGSDGTLALALASGAEPQGVARRIAERLAADEVLRSRLEHGLDLAVLPPDSRLPSTALYRG